LNIYKVILGDLWTSLLPILADLWKPATHNLFLALYNFSYIFVTLSELLQFYLLINYVCF